MPTVTALDPQTARRAMHNDNALKIGFFGMNCSSARTATVAPERWLATWPDCLKLARLADDAGIDFLLPIGRWKGYGGPSDFHGTTLETMTWASGLLGATRRITIFGTVHAPLFHPLIAAKEFVTADHIGEGRFGLNIVAGWNEGEFEMFGVEQRPHDERYDFAQEWVDVVNRAWSDEEQFDFNGRYFKLEGVRAKPKPFGGTRPLIMNAGHSGAGQAFAMRNCDAFFTSTGVTRLAAAKHQQAGVGSRLDRAHSEKGRVGQGGGPGDRPLHRDLYAGPGDLPCNAERGGGLSPLRQCRAGRLASGRADAGTARRDAGQHAGRRV